MIYKFHRKLFARRPHSTPLLLLTLFTLVFSAASSFAEETTPAWDCNRMLKARQALYNNPEAISKWNTLYKEHCPPTSESPGVPFYSSYLDEQSGVGEVAADGNTAQEAVPQTRTASPASTSTPRAPAAAPAAQETSAEGGGSASDDFNNTAYASVLKACGATKKLQSENPGYPQLGVIKDDVCDQVEPARVAANKLSVDGPSPIYTTTLEQAKSAAEEGLNKAQSLADKERDLNARHRNFSKDIKTCEGAYTVAQECCTRPESCLKKPDGEPSEKDGAVGDAIKMAVGVAAGVPASSMSAMCGKMQKLGNVMTLFNGYLAMQCSRFVGECKTKCREPAGLKDEIENSCTFGQESYDSPACKKLIGLQIALEEHTTGCATADNGSIQMASQAVASQAAAKYAGLCKDLVTEAPPTGENLNPEDLFANTNCANPTAQTMAFCQAQCSRPGAEQDPNCAAFLGKLNNSGTGQFNNGGIDPNSLFGNLGVGDEGSQGPIFEDIKPVNAGSTGVGAGGGGGLPGGGGGGDSGDGSGGDGGSEGHNTKIDRGLASGNGYSSGGGRIMSGSGGGFAGYGNSKAITNSGKAFNLKDFLPSSKTQIKPFRGLASAAQEISSQHEDIFKKVTARFYQLCLRDALYDCASLQKIKTGGN